MTSRRKALLSVASVAGGLALVGWLWFRGGSRADRAQSTVASEGRNAARALDPLGRRPPLPPEITRGVPLTAAPASPFSIAAASVASPRPARDAPAPVPPPAYPPPPPPTGINGDRPDRPVPGL